MTGRLALFAILAGLLAIVLAEPPKAGRILPVDDLENPPPAQQPKVVEDDGLSFFPFRLMRMRPIPITFTFHSEPQIEGRHVEAVEPQQPKKLEGTCESRCNDEVVGNMELNRACKSGCRLFKVIESVDGPSFFSLTPKDDMSSSHKNCNNSCVLSFNKPHVSEACQVGCGLQIPYARERRQQARSPLDSFFGRNSEMSQLDDSPFSLLDSMFGGRSGVQPSVVSSNNINTQSSFGSMFDRMNSMMSSMMSSGLNGQIGGGNGRMIVHHEGPGFSETKTYKINPDGSRTEIPNESQEVESSEETREREIATNHHDDAEFLPGVGKDAIAEWNPLEKYFDPSEDVETFKPISSGGSEREHQVLNKDEEMILDQVFDDMGLQRDGPNLPEDGLRPRFRDPRYYKEYICSQPKENMRWADWVSCQHIRLGLPSGLTCGLISLGIVFIIWLCLAIPQNAPRRRLRNIPSSDSLVGDVPAMTSTESAAAKEAEAKKLKEEFEQQKGAGYAQVHEKPPRYENLDMPPAYNEASALEGAAAVAAEATPEVAVTEALNKKDTTDDERV